MVDFFSTNPEAVAALLIFAAASLTGWFAFLWSLFNVNPIMYRLIADRSIIRVIEDAPIYISVSVSRDNLTHRILERDLQQWNIEFFNSDPCRLHGAVP